MDPDSIIMKLGLLVFLLLINAFFAMSEIAVISLNDTKLQHQAEEGNRRAKTLVWLLKEPSNFLSAIQIGVTFSNLLSSAVAADQFAEILTRQLAFLPISPSVLHAVSLVLLTLLLGYFTLVVGELVPKRIAMCAPEKVAFAVAPILGAIYRVERPLVWVLSHSTNGVVRLLGVKAESEQERVTEEEIRMMVDVGSEKGVIEPGEKDMIDNIFDFDDRTAGEVMTHRTEVSSLEITATVQEAVQLATETGFSRIPVYEDDIDSIVGILHVKDLLPLVAADNTTTLKIKDYVRPVLFVPESNSCTDLLRAFREKKVHMAVVVDEYGGTAGVVTMEDLLEAIVGNIQDEYDNEEEEYYRLPDGSYRIDGTLSLEETEKLLKLNIPDDEDYDTLGGLLTDRLGRIPQEGEHPQVKIGRVLFTVEGVEERRISKVLAQILPQPENLPAQ